MKTDIHNKTIGGGITCARSVIKSIGDVSIAIASFASRFPHHAIMCCMCCCCCMC